MLKYKTLIKLFVLICVFICGNTVQAQLVALLCLLVSLYRPQKKILISFRLIVF